MSEAKTYVKLPVEREAIQFKGGNFHEVWDFVGARQVDANHEVLNFHPIGTFLHPDLCDPYARGELWVEANKQWLPLVDGEWILKDSVGFYPCKDEVFRAEYIKALSTCETPTFEQELVSLINKHSMENFSGTPDYILAAFLTGVLRQYDCAVKGRAIWRDESTELPALQRMEGDDITNT